MARIRNETLFAELDEYLQRLKERGLTVKLWRIPRVSNMGADKLAGEKQRQWEEMIMVTTEYREGEK